MTSDREFEELFSSRGYMLRKAHRNRWPRSPQALVEMRDYLIDALEPTYQAFARPEEREQPKRRPAA